MFNEMMEDIIKLEKKNGTVIENIKSMVQGKIIHIGDHLLPIEEGDHLTRTLANGLVESYLVLDRGYMESFAGEEAHYQVEVIKEVTRELERRNFSSSNHYNIGPFMVPILAPTVMRRLQIHLILKKLIS